jgi:hypothetical protein
LCGGRGCVRDLAGFRGGAGLEKREVIRMDEIERMNIVALRADVVFGRPLLTELLENLNTNGLLMVGIIEDIDPMQILLEQILEMEKPLQELIDFRKESAR